MQEAAAWTYPHMLQINKTKVFSKHRKGLPVDCSDARMQYYNDILC